MDSFSGYSGNNGYSTLGEINFPIYNRQAKQVDGEGMRDIRIVEAIYKAAKTGTTVKIG